jgi:hypothetical protein
MKKLPIVALLCLMSVGAHAVQTNTPNLDRSRDLVESYLKSQGIHEAIVSDVYHSAYWFVVNEVCGDDYATKDAAVNIMNVNYGVWAEGFGIPRSTFNAYVTVMKDRLKSTLRINTSEIGPFCKEHKEITTKKSPTTPSETIKLPPAQGLD